MKKIRKITCIFLCILLTVVLVGCSSKVKIKDNISIEYDGYDGYATANINVDWGEINSQVDAEKLKRFELNVFGDTYTTFNDSGLQNFIAIEMTSENTGLSNEDKITVSLTLDDYYESKGGSFEQLKENGYTFKEVEFTFVVSELEHRDVLDLTQVIDDIVIFTGANDYAEVGVTIPDGYIKEIGLYKVAKTNDKKLNIIKDNQLVGTASYSVSDTIFKTGDSVEVKVYAKTNEIYDLDIQNGGLIILSNYTYTVTVPELGHYVMNRDQVTDDIINEVKKVAAAQGRNTKRVYFREVTEGGINEPAHFIVVYDWGWHMDVCSAYSVVVKTDGTYDVLHSKYDGDYLTNIFDGSVSYKDKSNRFICEQIG